jgi:hypothetical protein
MPLRFVWGVRDVDDGDYLDPGDRGGLHYDRSFDVTSGENFIHKAKTVVFNQCSENALILAVKMLYAGFLSEISSLCG